MPDGVLINGKGPYRYNSTLVPKGISYETINVYPGNDKNLSSLQYLSTLQDRTLNWKSCCTQGFIILRVLNSLQIRRSNYISKLHHKI